jgi:hypothetical protein
MHTACERLEGIPEIDYGGKLMYGSNVEDCYRYDVTFHRVVDQMRSLLSMYHITPGELREASLLAATMHESENVRPLYVSYDEYGRSKFNHKTLSHLVPSPSYPAMFGGKPEQWYSYGVKWKPVLTCICAVKEEKIHTATCNHYNWEYWHQKHITVASVPLGDPNLHHHVHSFRSSGYGYDVCNDCGISDVFYNWAYNKKS